MLNAIKNFFGGRKSVSLAPRQISPAQMHRVIAQIRARYDAAQTTDNNRRHWQYADALGPNASNLPAVRRTLRMRARYEVANNSYARGIVQTLANDCIGTGPRLHMHGEDTLSNQFVETEFMKWMKRVSVGEKLRTMRMAKTEDGESFGIMISNPGLNTPVKLDLKLIEADQMSAPPMFTPLTNSDGILFDDYGNPVEYQMLKQHPGEMVGTQFQYGYLTVPAASVIHYFRADRPGQTRGIPELTPALTLFAMLRDYTLATLDAAKAAAYFAGILYTDSAAADPADLEPLDPVSLERNSLVTMPNGWKMGQVHAEQPVGTYDIFKHELINEVARCLNMPFNIAAGNSSTYNYASGRMDHQVYHKSIGVEQAQIEATVLDRLFSAWVNEAVLIEGYLPSELRSTKTDWSHQWFWDGHEHVDPSKEASAQATKLQNNTTTLMHEYAKVGRNWEVEIRQRAKEFQLLNELGIPALWPTPAPLPAPAYDEEEEPAQTPPPGKGDTKKK